MAKKKKKKIITKSVLKNYRKLIYLNKYIFQYFMTLANIIKSLYY